MNKKIIHMGREKGDYPLCELGALVQYLTWDWSTVTCNKCREIGLKEMEKKHPQYTARDEADNDYMQEHCT